MHSLEEILNDHRTGQDSTQLETFVLGGRTVWGQYKQAVRELYKRVRGLRQTVTDRDLLLIDIEELEEEAAGDDRDARRAQIKLRQKQGQLEETTRCLMDIERECAVFYRAACDLKDSIGSVDEARRNQLDREEWLHWHKKKAALDKLTTGRISEVVLKNIASVPVEERVQWLTAVNENPAAIIEAEDLGRPALPAPTAEDIQQVKMLTSSGH